MMGGKNDGTTAHAGAIREAGGAFAKMEVAHEEEYFYKVSSLSAFRCHWPWKLDLYCENPFVSPQKRQEQLTLLKKKQVDESAFRENAIKDHEAAIKRHQDAIDAARK